MSETSKLEKEYDTLRSELNENKKYVFERPLLIFSSALVLFKLSSDISFASLIPGFFTFLLVFNLHFTYNRLLSSARIIAYIRLRLESEKEKKNDFYWETFLFKYRKGLKAIKMNSPVNNKNEVLIEKKELEQDASNKVEEPKQAQELINKDNVFRFYPIIFYFHIVSIIILGLLETLIFLRNYQFSFQKLTWFDTITVVSSIVLFCGSIIYLFLIRKLIYPDAVQHCFSTTAVDVERILND